MPKPPAPRPYYMTEREQRRYRRAGNARGAAAIKAFSPARKPGVTESRSQDELLNDLLCDLRQWAVVNEVDFDDAVASSETHHLIDTGELAENHIEIARHAARA